MLTVGLTGPSGAGKGTVAAIFARYGIPAIDTDAVYHELLFPPSPCLDELAERFGDSILAADGTLDRAALAEIVFAPGHAAELSALNAISHRHVLREVRAMLEVNRMAEIPLTLVDAPQLFESGFDRECDLVLAVLAPHDVRLRRIMARDDLTQERAEARLSATLSDDVFQAKADHVIRNDGDHAALEQAVRRLLCDWGVYHEA